MADSSFGYLISSFVGVILFILFLWEITKAKTKKTAGDNKTSHPPPPSPAGIPFLGHLHLLRKPPLHRLLARLSAEHGPVLLLKLGSRRVLVVNSVAAAEECFTNNDVAFANRPRLLAGKHLGYDYTSISWAPYGPHWRNLRRFTTLEVFSSARVNASSDLRSGEVRELVGTLFKDHLVATRQENDSTMWQASSWMRAEMKPRFFELACNVMMKTVAGRRHDERRLREMVEEGFKLSGASNLGDFLPVLSWLGFRRFEKRIIRLKGMRDEFFQGLVDKHRHERRSGGGGAAVIDVLLSLQDTDPEYYTDDIIKGLITSLLSAGTDTSAVTIEWAMSLLLNNPQSLKKLTAEIDANVDQRRIVDESDLANLPYLHATIKETLRLYPAGPLLVPHESSEDTTVGGYGVPRGTMLLVNAWAIQRDPGAWEDPETFRPERFLDGGDEGLRMIPFGHGRRRCPGEGLAVRLVGSTLGALLQCFEWERVGGVEVDMSEGPGLTMPKARPLEAMFKPRGGMLDALSQLAN